jgi:D-alanyl-D-alanine carboxypeptidase (penicillin-binding protein 5/6)
MTMYLIYDALETDRIALDDTVTVSEFAAGMGGSQIFLEPTERQTVRDLLKAVVIASANDAAVALAEYISGSEESFVSLMNQTAADMGLENTHFRNACGLDADGHYMSARDIAVLTMELVNKHPSVFEYSTIWMDTITHGTFRCDHKKHYIAITHQTLKYHSLRRYQNIVKAPGC